MDEAIRVIGGHDLPGLVIVCRHVSKAVSGGDRYRDRPGLSAPLQANNNIFLQDPVVMEYVTAGTKQMQMTDGRALQNEVPERTVIWSVTETARDDGHHLPSRHHFPERQGDKGAVQVHRFNPHAAEGFPVSGLAADFSVRRIQDGMRVAPFKQPVCRGLHDIVVRDDFCLCHGIPVQMASEV